MLPQHYEGEPIEVEGLTEEERKTLRLSTSDTIVECVGNQRLVSEAVEYAYEKGIIAIDTETSGLDIIGDKIVIIQLGDETRQYLIWADTVDIEPILDLLWSDEVTKVGTNLKYDLSMFRAGYGARARNVADTQLMEAVMNCGMMGEVAQALGMTSMDAQARRWLGLSLPKDLDLRTGWEDMTPGDWKTDRHGKSISRGIAKRFYAADDVVVPLLVARLQKPWIQHLGLTDTVRLEHRFLPVLVEQEVRGLKLDWEAWVSLAKEAEAQLEETTKELGRLFRVTEHYRVDAEGNVTVTADKNYRSASELAECIAEYMHREHGITAVCNNRQYREALEKAGVAKVRLDEMFSPRMVLNPYRPGRRMKVGYPDMTDVLTEHWDATRHLLPEDALALPSLDSRTLRLMAVVWETEPAERDPELPNRIGLPPELVDPILRYRDLTKKLGTYGLEWERRLSPHTGRLHVNSRQAFTATGRVSTVPATQNFPRDPRYRACFVPDEGYKYVSADYSQIEPRIIAEMSYDPTYMRAFWSTFPGTDGFRYWCGDDVNEPLDLYVEVGKQVGIIPQHFTVADCSGDDAVEEGVIGRDQAKIVALALSYGTGPENFWITIMLDTERHYPKEYTDTLFYGFWRVASNVKNMLDNASALAHPSKSKRKIWHPLTKGYVTWAETLGGRKRFFRPTSRAHYTEARNAPIQGTGSDILKAACVCITDRLWEAGVDGYIAITAHDEIVIEVEEGRAEEVAEWLEEEMVRVGQYYCPHVPITADAKVTDKWEA